MITETILFILEIVGTVAFAVSGAFVAIKARFDIFGVLVIGCVTAVGGGITRDILIGSTPPLIFERLYIILIASGASLIAFFVAYVNRNRFDDLRERIEQVNNIFDAIGLATFTIMGTELAFTNGLSSNVFLSITLGVLTGVGGGLLRDIFTETPPYIFKKHVYAVAAICGALMYYVIRLYVENTILPTAVSIVFIIGIRMLATKYLWSLPKITLREEKENKS